MKGQKRALLFLASAGVELCYLYACTNFATEAILHRTFPFPEAVGSFLLAALLTLFSAGRGWRVIYVLGLQSLGFIPVLLRLVHIFSSWSDSFLRLTWLTDFYSRSEDAVEYAVFILVIVWIFVFWAGGVGLAKRPKDYATVCVRFDRGLIAFFTLFLTKLYLEAVQGIQASDSTSGVLLFPFLMFSLLAIGLVRTGDSAQRNFLPGYQTIGVMLGFIVVVLLAGTGLVFFSLPFLTLAAEKGSDLLAILSGPLVLLLFSITDWLFGADFGTANNLPPPPTATKGPDFQWSGPWWLEFLGKILASGVMILFGLVLLTFLGVLLYFVFQWLFSRTALDPERRSPRNLACRTRALLFNLWRSLVHALTGYKLAVQLYAALRTWGRHKGVPHLIGETPREYGLRLTHRFPVLGREIDLIIEAFNLEVYGETVLNERQMIEARSAWRGVSNSLHWPARV